VGGGQGDDSTTTANMSSEEHHAMYQAQLADLQAEREFLFGFTDDEKEAWSSLASLPPENNNNDTNSSWQQQQQQQLQHQAFLQAIEEARLAQEGEGEGSTSSSSDQNQNRSTFSASSSSSSSSPLTHLSDDGTSIHMVDVGSKEVTQRIARAQTKVIFPPAVVKALLSYKNNKDSNNNKNNFDDEVIGPKGPIFATAKIAGIMAAK
jgi:MoaC family